MHANHSQLLKTPPRSSAQKKIFQSSHFTAILKSILLSNTKLKSSFYMEWMHACRKQPHLASRCNLYYYVMQRHTYTISDGKHPPQKNLLTKTWSHPPQTGINRFSHHACNSTCINTVYHTTDHFRVKTWQPEESSPPQPNHQPIP